MIPTILFVDDDADVLLAGEQALYGGGLHVLTAPSPAAALATLREHAVAVLLLDLNFRRGATSGAEGLRCLAQIRQEYPDTVVVVVTAHGGVGLAVQAMQAGATDFIAKPWDNERLQATVRNAAALYTSRRTAAQLQLRARELGRPAAAAGPELIGQSPAWLHVLSMIERVAPTDANVLILGENGSGKEGVAQAVHRASRRAAGPLVAVDMGSVPATLFESELFGHRKGAFTDARGERVGRIAAADGGTLFLDEIGNLPLALQPKLLAALERRQVLPLGGNDAVPVDVRVISATNVSRDTLADEQQFRADLLFRLNTVEIHVPPLRQRKADIPLLAEHFLRHYTQKYGKPQRAFSEAALRAMGQHDWPGNVRALRHAVERAVVMSGDGAGSRIGPEDLALATSAAPARTRGAAPASDDLNLERAERQLIERALSQRAWNISLAAKDLGLTRASLYRRMQRHGL